MLKVYGVTRSRAFRTLWLLEELGLEHERVLVDYLDGGTRSEAYRAINPNGRIPAIEDDGLVLWESMAVNLYLAERYGAACGTALWPGRVADRGRAYQWSFWVMTEVERHLLQVLHQRRTAPPERRDPERLRQAEGALRRPFGVLDAALAGGAYLLGDAFTVADLNVAAVLIWCRPGAVELSPWPHLARWLDACLERPARRRVTADRRRGPALAGFTPA